MKESGKAESNKKNFIFCLVWKNLTKRHTSIHDKIISNDSVVKRMSETYYLSVENR